MLATVSRQSLWNRRALVQEAQVWPMSNALQMGWSWSLYFAQAVTSSVLSGLPCQRDSLSMSDQDPLLVLQRDFSGHNTRVDSLGLLLHHRACEVLGLVLGGNNRRHATPTSEVGVGNHIGARYTFQHGQEGAAEHFPLSASSSNLYQEKEITSRTPGKKTISVQDCSPRIKCPVVVSVRRPKNRSPFRYPLGLCQPGQILWRFRGRCEYDAGQRLRLDFGLPGRADHGAAWDYDTEWEVWLLSWSLMSG